MTIAAQGTYLSDYCLLPGERSERIACCIPGAKRQTAYCLLPGERSERIACCLMHGVNGLPAAFPADV